MHYKYIIVFYVFDLIGILLKNIEKFNHIVGEDRLSL